MRRLKSPQILLILIMIQLACLTALINCIMSEPLFSQEISLPGEEEQAMMDGKIERAEVDQASNKKVLVLHALKIKRPWNVLFNSYLIEALEEMNLTLENVDFESLDLLQFKEEKYLDLEQRELEFKYADSNPDIIIATFTSSIDFILERNLFPDVPKIFVLPTSSGYQDVPNSVVIPIAYDFKGNIEHALALLPDTKIIYVVAGNGLVDKRFLSSFREETEELKDRVSFHYLDDLDVEKLLRQIESLPDHSVLYYLTYSLDFQGKAVITRDFSKRIAEHSNRPVFSFLDLHALNIGILGGRMTTTKASATIAADIIKRVFDGESIDSIIPDFLDPGYIYQWEELEKWGIDLDKLPPGSVIQNEPINFFELFKWRILGGIILLIAETLLIFFLIINIIKRKGIESRLLAEIEEHENAKEGLLGSNRRFLSLVENAAEAIVVAQDRTVKYCNPQAVKLTGYSAEELGMRDVIDFIHSEDREILLNEYNARLSVERPIGNYSLRIITKDEVQKHVLVNSALIDWDGKPATLAMFTDITKSKQAQEDLMRSEERFRATFEQAAVGIAHFLPDGQFLRINKKFCDITGYSREELLKLTFREITHPDDLDADIRYHDQLLAGEIDTYSMEKRYFRKNGEMTWINLTVSLVRNEAKEPKWIVSVISDINKRKLAEERLRKSEEKFRKLIANIPDVTWTTDSNYNTTFISSNIQRLYGYSPEEIYAQPGILWLDRIHPEDVEDVKRAFGALFETDSPFDIEYRIKKKNGDWIWLHDRSIATYQTKGIMYADGVLADITERKLAEEALMKSEERFRSLMEQSPMAIEILSPEGQIKQVNRAWGRLWGFKKEDITDVLKSYNMLTDKQTEDLGVASLIRKAFEGEVVVLPPIEYVANKTTEDIGLEHIKGRSPWIQCHLYPVKNPDGKVLFVVNTYVEITELKEMELELKKSEAHLRRAQEVANAGSWELNILNGVLFWSTEVYRIFGTPPGEPLNYEAFLERVHPEERVYVDQSWQAAMQGSPYDIEHRILADGQIKWVREKAKVDFDEAGKAIKGIGIVQDVTERKQSELQIREMASFAQLNPAPVLRINPDGIIMSCNPASVEILGKNAKKGTSITSILPDFSKIDLKQCIRDDMLLSQEVDIKGRFYHFILRGVSDLKLLYIYGSDISKRKKATEEIQQLRNEYAHIARVSVMGELTASLAHELKQPLAAMRSNAQAAQRFLTADKPDIDELHEILKDIIKDNRRADDVIIKLRALMQKSELKIDQLNINEAIEDILPIINSYELMRNISLTFELEKNIPHVNGDRIQLQQVVLNLILNSSEALMNSEQKSSSIIVRTNQNSEYYVTISVTDNGPGIDDTVMNHLFEPFYTTKKEGLGMGLAICKTIIDGHKGRFWAENNHDRGATFYITIPTAMENQA